ncbi:unnamed protein product, partial [Brassica napus]
IGLTHYNLKKYRSYGYRLTAIANHFPIGYPSFHYSSSSTLNSEVLSECAPEKMAAPTLSDSTKRILCKWYGFIYFQTGNLAEIKSI